MAKKEKKPKEKKEKEQKASKGNSGKKLNVKKLLSFVPIALELVLMIMIIINITKLGFLPLKHILAGAAAVVVTMVLFVLLKRTKAAWLGYTLSVFTILVLCAGFYVISNISNYIAGITGTEEITQQYSVLVMMEDDAKEISDTYTYLYGYNCNADKQLLEDAVVEVVKDNKNIKPVLKDLGGVYQEVKKLLSGEIKTILFNEGARPMITDVVQNFNYETRILKTYDFKTSVKDRQNERDLSKDCFAVYVSGTDKDGRTALAALMAVNPSTKQVLCVALPVDAWIYLKTDAGEFGENIGNAQYFNENYIMDTMQAMFQIDVDYYMNFTFDESVNTADAASILEWIQQNMVSGSILFDSKYISNLTGMVESNFSFDNMADLVKVYLNSKKDWNISLYAIGGQNVQKTGVVSGVERMTVTQMDDVMLENAKKYIQNIFNGSVVQE